MDPLEYGWELKDGDFVPVMTEDAIAPESIIGLVSCCCKGLLAYSIVSFLSKPKINGDNSFLVKFKIYHNF